MPTQKNLKALQEKAQSELEQVGSHVDLEAWRVKYLGRKGQVPAVLRQVKDLPPDQKKVIGHLGNQIRQQLEARYQRQQSSPSGSKSENINPGHDLPMGPGHLHPLTRAARRLQNIMADLGFLIVEGPEVEQEFYDFDALNIPFEHPARAESDSFYIHPRQPQGQGLGLRTSTSAMQVRAVLENDLKPPFKLASPGRVFRSEKPDATHESAFHQIEAIFVDKEVTIANYKAITATLFSRFFGSDAHIRLRPGYFPFVEPGFEVDMSCPFCKNGCRVCKQSRWIEMGGAGMVHPNVLKNMNINPEHYQGFAFGYGIDRFTMLHHAIDDIRLLWSGDLRFLKQFI